MVAEVQICRAESEDAAGLRAFAASLYGERLREIFLHDEVPSTEQQRQFIAGFSNARAALFLAKAADEVVGMLGFRGHARPQLAHSGVMALSVRRDFRRTGVGDRLMAALAAWVAEHAQVRRVELDVFVINTAARRLFAKHGFEVEGSMRGAVEVDGKLIDNLLMARSW